ncbi:MAG TPA: hypothetical protein VH413_15455 [Verrucomicrobiae bacterium]|jgi:hypothetical protein|nr:hypothetical protein [Verrucomicrobiae bacterium]
MTLTSRRHFAWVLFAIAAIVAWVVDYALRIELRRAEIVTGLTLFIVVVFLTLFNARKKLPFLPLLRASTWMQIHIYVGLLSCVLFGLHTGWRVPTGTFETTLAILFYLVAISGIVGLGISRWLPARLTVYGENVIFERIPALRATLRREVEEMVLESVGKAQSSAIADFYDLRLRNFFQGTRYMWYHVIGYRQPLLDLLSEVRGLERYLNAEEQAILAQIVERIHARDDLDFQKARQGVLKGWLFIHIPLTYSMLIAAMVHGVLAWRLS